MNEQSISPEQLSKFKKIFTKKMCFYPSCGSLSTIRAHSIQENGPLKILADLINGQMEVYYLDDEFDYDIDSKTMVSKHQTKRKLHHRGIGSTSVFNGFCLKHDAIFKTTIEDATYTGSVEQLFFHSYRCFAYFMHKSYEKYSGLADVMKKLKQETGTRPEIPILPDNEKLGKLGGQLNSLLGSIGGMLDELDGVFDTLESKSNEELFGLKLKKDRFDEALEKKKYSNLKYWQRSISGIYPIACSSVVHYLDVMHQQSSDGTVYPAELAITIFPDTNKTKTHIIISGFEDNPNFNIVIHKLRALGEKYLLKFISDLLLHRGSNVYLSPRLYNKMTMEEKKELIQQRASNEQSLTGLPNIKLNLFAHKFIDEDGS